MICLTRRAMLFAALTLAAPGWAETAAPDPRLVAAANDAALAYILTGDAGQDETSRAGLAGLSQVLAERTTLAPGTPVGVDPDRDDLSMLNLIYWPVTVTQPLPSPEGYVRLNHFLQSGGMIVFDTRDGEGGAGAEQDALRELAAPLNIPALATLPPDHVLTRSFYLLKEFPGRWNGAPVWVEATASPTDVASRNDGVSPVVIGANDWAAAWAVDNSGLPLHQIGGPDGERQREMALRFGVNLVMYALTGNYKSDQVHVGKILERLGQEGATP